jgi:biotin carboxyl carrier protein
MGIAKGDGVRAFNVYVGDEFYRIEVEPVDDTTSKRNVPAVESKQPEGVKSEADGQLAEQSFVEEEEAPAVKATRVEGTELVAPIPGTIIRYVVNTGDEVSSGDGVVVLEAMKMENELTAPVDGKIVAINCKPGDSVKVGDVLAVIG